MFFKQPYTKVLSIVCQYLLVCVVIIEALPVIRVQSVLRNLNVSVKIPIVTAVSYLQCK